MESIDKHFDYMDSLNEEDKKGTPTPELDDALADNAPLVFGTLIIISTLLVTVIPIFKPF